MEKNEAQEEDGARSRKERRIRSDAKEFRGDVNAHNNKPQY